MKLLLTRPDADAVPLAALLEAAGHTAVPAPLLRIVPHAENLPLDGVAALLFTSANGVRAFAGASPRRDLPVYAVGERTAAAAIAAGFTRVEAAGGDVDALAALIPARRRPGDGKLLHVRGVAVAGDLAASLRVAGFTVESVRLYEAEPVPHLPEVAIRALKSGTLDGVLLFSPRTARLFAELTARDGCAAEAAKIDAWCLSPAVAAALGEGRVRRIHVAHEPTQAALLEDLAAASGNGQRRDPAAPATLRRDTAYTDTKESDAQGPGKKESELSDDPKPSAATNSQSLPKSEPPESDSSRPAEAKAVKAKAATAKVVKPAASAPAAAVPPVTPAPAEAPATKIEGAKIEGARSESTFGPRSETPEPAVAAAKPVRRNLHLGLVAAGLAIVIVLGSSPFWFPSLQNRLNEHSGGDTPLAETPAANLSQPGAAAGTETAPPNDGLAGNPAPAANPLPVVGPVHPAASPDEVEIDRLRAEVDALQHRLAASEAKPAADPAEQQKLAAQQQQLAGQLVTSAQQMDQRLARLEQQVRLDTAARQLQGAMALAAAQLVEAVDDARPYAAPLDVLKSAAGEDPAFAPALAALAPYAGSGVASRATLADDLALLPDRVAHASATPGSDSIWQRAKARAERLVTIRRVDETGHPEAMPPSNDRTLALALQHLDAGRLNEAVAEVRSLTGPAAAIAAPWLKEAEARLAVEQAAHAVLSAATGRLTAAAGSSSPHPTQPAPVQPTPVQPAPGQPAPGQPEGARSAAPASPQNPSQNPPQGTAL